MKQIVTVTGAAVGRDPFDRKSWSGSSYYLFTELQRRGLLRRAIVARPSRVREALHLARNFSIDRAAWRSRLNLDLAYRRSLTASARRQLVVEDYNYPVLQLAGYYDVPSVVTGRTRTYAFFDGNLASAIKSDYPPLGVSSTRMRRVLQTEGRMLQELDGVLTMSSYLRDSFIDDYGLSPDRVHNIGAGVNLDRIPNYSAEKRYDSQELLFVGADFRRKGGPGLLRAFTEVRRVYPKAVLHIVGPQEYSPERIAGVVWHGFLDKRAEEFQTLLASCVLFVLPSLWEPFGIAPLEAMLYQIPAVVSRRWALPESVPDGVAGRNVEPGDARGLANVLIELLSEPDHLRVMGSQARAHVLESYTWPRVVSRLAQVMHLEGT